MQNLGTEEDNTHFAGLLLNNKQISLKIQAWCIWLVRPI